MIVEQLTKQSHIINGFLSTKRKTIHGSYKSHWHEFFEIEYIVSGKGSYYIDGHRHEIAPGTLFFMSPVNFHRVEADHALVYNIMFSEGVCDPYFLSRALACNRTVLRADPTTAHYLEALMEELTCAEEDKHLASYLLSCIMAKFGSFPSDRLVGVSPISDAALFVLKNFRSNPSLEEAAARAGFSTSYFSELFRKQTGSNYKRFLDNVKFDYAKKLLLFTDMTALEVCVESGFNDYANFSRRFKRRFGASPDVYRSTETVAPSHSLQG